MRNVLSRGILLSLPALLLLTACDQATSEREGEQQSATFATAVHTGKPSDARTERTYIVPESVDPEAFALGEAEANANACGAPPEVFPHNTRVRVVEENGKRSLFVSSVGPSSGRADGRAMRGSNPEKGDGLVNATGELIQPASYSFSGETEFTCSCENGPQDQYDGCTTAFNPIAGHFYCDAYGARNQCKMEVKTPVVGG